MPIAPLKKASDAFSRLMMHAVERLREKSELWEAQAEEYNEMVKERWGAARDLILAGDVEGLRSYLKSQDGRRLDPRRSAYDGPYSSLFGVVAGDECAGKSLEILDVLWSGGQRAGLGLLDYEGRSPLHEALRWGRLDCAKWMVGKGAKLQGGRGLPENNDDCPSWLFAASGGDLGCMDLAMGAVARSDMPAVRQLALIEMFSSSEPLSGRDRLETLGSLWKRPEWFAAGVAARCELLAGACSVREEGVGARAAAFILNTLGPAAGQAWWTPGELSTGSLAAIHKDCLQVWSVLEKHGRFEDMEDAVSQKLLCLASSRIMPSGMCKWLVARGANAAGPDKPEALAVAIRECNSAAFQELAQARGRFSQKEGFELLQALIVNSSGAGTIESSEEMAEIIVGRSPDLLCEANVCFSLDLLETAVWSGSRNLLPWLLSNVKIPPQDAAAFAQRVQRECPFLEPKIISSLADFSAHSLARVQLSEIEATTRQGSATAPGKCGPRL